MLQTIETAPERRTSCVEGGAVPGNPDAACPPRTLLLAQRPNSDCAGAPKAGADSHTQGAQAETGDPASSSTDAGPLSPLSPLSLRRRLLRRLAGQRGAATAEYAVATMAAVGFAGLLVLISRT